MTAMLPLSDLLIEMKNGTTADQNQEGVGLPVTRIETIANGTIDSNRVRFVDLDAQLASKWLLKPGDILLSHINSVEHIGKSAIYQGNPAQLVHGMNLMLLRADQQKVLPEYLHFGLRTARVRDHIKARCKRAVNQASINQKELGAIVLRIPSMADQARVVDILSRAESIVRLRRAAQQKAAELVPAIFLEMFGDPVSNPKGWPIVKLGDYLSIESVVKTPDPITDASLPCIGADSIESGSGKTVSWPTVEQIKPISGKYHFEKNDVLYSKIRPALRKAIVAPESGYCSADMYPLRPKSGIATPEFVAALLLSKAFTEYAIGVSARAQMPKVNRETLFAYEHPMPPITLQEAFAKRMQDVNSIQRQQESALAQSDLVFASLLGKSFS